MDVALWTWHALLEAFTRRARAIGRRFTPPGNRAPIAESGNYRPGSSSVVRRPLPNSIAHRRTAGWAACSVLALFRHRLSPAE